MEGRETHAVLTLIRSNDNAECVSCLRTRGRKGGTAGYGCTLQTWKGEYQIFLCHNPEGAYIKGGENGPMPRIHRSSFIYREKKLWNR